MRVVAASDLHGHLLAAMPPGDLLLLAGDLCPITNHSPVFQAEWLDGPFRRWLRGLPYLHIVGVAGNHDFVFQNRPDLLPRDLPWTYLEDSSCEIEGLRLWGSPWQPWFFDWAFNAHEPELKRIWDKIPDDTDILVLHGPPYGHGDGVPEGGGVRRTGCRHLLRRIEEVRPRLAVFGHIHEGRGAWKLGETTLANVTLLNAAYEPVFEPWMGEVNLR